MVEKTLFVCPRCNQVVVTQGGPGNRDIVHRCRSGNTTIDQEDVSRLNARNWHLQGIAKKGSSMEKILHGGVLPVNERGMKKDLYISEQHEEFVELK